MRFLPGEAALGDRSDSGKSSMNNDSSVPTVVTDDDKEKLLDEDYISNFRARTTNDDSVLYIERLTDWSECPELGAIGDLLASSDQASVVSVLVVQQYVGMGQGNHFLTPDSPGQQLHDHFNFSYHRTQIHALEAFIVIYLFL
ncbi:hypothetical protein BC332_30488 [Capsicum chinense]|nr:hypothetical protein BC332_30488 [Capsicum chinense]